MTKKANYLVNESLFLTGVKRFELAQKMGISSQTLYRKLRLELPLEEQKEICEVIRCIAENKG